MTRSALSGAEKLPSATRSAPSSAHASAAGAPKHTIVPGRGTVAVASPTHEAPPTEVKAPRSKTASRVTFIQARLTDLDARSTMGAHLDRLIEAMEAAAADEDPDGPFGPEAIDSMANHLRSALGGLDERLVWALDDAMMAPSPELRARHEAKAAALVGEYLRFLEGEPLFDDLDEETGFGRFPIVETARKSLEQIATLL